MHDQPSPANYRVYPKGPNFLLIVILSGIALVIMMILAYLILSGAGEFLVPASDHGATARLLWPVLGHLVA
jgi:hypothetical protein